MQSKTIKKSDLQYIVESKTEDAHKIQINQKRSIEILFMFYNIRLQVPKNLSMSE